MKERDVEVHSFGLGFWTFMDMAEFLLLLLLLISSLKSLFFMNFVKQLLPAKIFKLINIDKKITYYYYFLFRERGNEEDDGKIKLIT